MMLLNCILFFLLFFSITYSMPCPSECICKPTDIINVDFARMSYLMDCSNQSLNTDQLIYNADKWSINEDKIMNNDDDDYDDNNNSIKDYIISIDLSNSLSLTKFTSQTIQLTGFSYLIQSLSLTNQSKSFRLESNSFDSSLYENLKLLNLSSCCQYVPNECSQLFQPLKTLQILDLSGSDMYKTCLSTPNMISSKLTDLILRNNIYDENVFSNTSHLFYGVRQISGKLDLQNSYFQLNDEQEGNCLFNIFQQITILDLSSIKIQSNINDIEVHLAYFIKCETRSDDNRDGEQILELYLRQLNIEQLPEWFTNERFPFLRQLDLSNNNLYSININEFANLRHISLAYNPIELDQIAWRDDTFYRSINLRGTIRNRTLDLSHRLKNLFKLTTNIDYSENEGYDYSNLTTIPIGVDFPASQSSLNISRTNINSFEFNYSDLYRLDISSNFLEELNLDEYNKLNYLDCSNQYLIKLKLNKQLKELNELKCSNNFLTTIENFSLLKNKQLRLIDLSNNSINSLENLFSNLKTCQFLRIINLKSNLIEIIPSNIFHKKLISLYEINLSWNKIHTIKKDAFQAPNLQILDLRGNPLINIESKAILTRSLRLFYVFNNTQQVNNRCLESKSYDNLLFIYLNWYANNGRMMMTNEQIEFDQCLNRYVNQTKINWIIIKGKRFFGHYTLYITTGLAIMGVVIFGGMYFYRKNKLTFFQRFRRYKRLDRTDLIENATEMDQRPCEEDEIVMNIREPPFNKLSSVKTDV